MKKDEGNDKDKYRKKPFTPNLKDSGQKKLRGNIECRLNKLVEECKKKRIPKNTESNLLDEYFKNDSNLEVFLSAPDALKKSFVELDSSGASLEIIISALSPNTPESFRKAPPCSLETLRSRTYSSLGSNKKRIRGEKSQLEEIRDKKKSN